MKIVLEFPFYLFHGTIFYGEGYNVSSSVEVTFSIY